MRRDGLAGDDLERQADARKLAEQASQLFDRPPPPGYLEEWAAVLAETEAEQVIECFSFLVFRVAQTWLGLPTSVLVEVIESRPIHRVPHRVGGLLRGLVSIRGRLSPCVDIARLLFLDGTGRGIELPKNRRIVVVEAADEAGWIAFEADEVIGVHTATADQLRGIPSASDQTAECCEATFRWREQTVGVLDPHRFLHAVEVFDR